MVLLHQGNLSLGGDRTGSRDHGRGPADFGQLRRLAGFHQALTRKIGRQPHRHAGTPGNEFHVGAGFAQRHQMLVGDGIEYRVADALLAQIVESGTNRCRALHHRGILHQTDLVPGLPLQHAHQRRIGHRRQRMVAHAGFRQQLIADEKITLIDGALVGREGRIEYREIGAQSFEQRIGYRTDVALFGGVEGRAVLEVVLFRPLLAQPDERAQRHGHGFRCGIAARLERYDHAVGVRHFQIRSGNPKQLDGSHAGLDERIGKVGRAGEIVGHAAEQDAHTDASG